ncbi:MAG: 3-hydroxyacyl-CoA dehydrogenase NAD-binding domain-containing protein, partial [Actinomycetes bacterium]
MSRLPDVAIVEPNNEMTAVRKILAQLDALLPAQTLVATNTSSISITKLAAATQRPDRFI